MNYACVLQATNAHLEVNIRQNVVNLGHFFLCKGKREELGA